METGIVSPLLRSICSTFVSACPTSPSWVSPESSSYLDVHSWVFVQELLQCLGRWEAQPYWGWLAKSVRAQRQSWYVSTSEKRIRKNWQLTSSSCLNETFNRTFPILLHHLLSIRVATEEVKEMDDPENRFCGRNASAVFPRVDPGTTSISSTCYETEILCYLSDLTVLCYRSVVIMKESFEGSRREQRSWHWCYNTGCDGEGTHRKYLQTSWRLIILYILRATKQIFLCSNI